MPFNEECREINEVHEHDAYDELSVKWVSAKNLKAGDKVLLADGSYGIVKKVEGKLKFKHINNKKEPTFY